ncbi:MAG: hypothetical protein QHJ73_00690, partial [Armatimonadota bacterium]|nr:hypothetical protein [Armatimonadota bacterium]
MMALPRMSFGEYNWTYTVQLPFLLVTAVVITRWVLPRYREEGCISVYEFLERRINVSARLLASTAFVLLSIGRMGLVLYLPALALASVTGVNLVAAIVVMGVIVTIYTVLGGIRGVIWTDAIQVVIFVAGALATLFFVFAPGVDFMAIARQHNKFQTFIWSLDITRITTLWLILETLFQTIRIYATQQDMTQRYLAAESTRKANQSVWLAILGYIPLGYLFYFIGTALFVYYTANPDPRVTQMAAEGKLDALYAYFVVTRMPQGLAGLVIAAFVAAAQSTISSSMNSASAVCVEDFYKRFWGRGRSEDHYLRVARWLSVAWGILTIVMAILFMRVEAAQIAWQKVMGISTCGVLGLMALAFLPRRVSAVAAIVGFAASYLSLFTMMYFLQITPKVALVTRLEKNTGINFLLWPVVTNLVCFGVALLVDRLVPRKENTPRRPE